ncbi:glycosyltransferase family 2 protein [Anditalea andensis]|uniref:Glycosyltransferase 2-like domain-containing protein n=1 Tax=Anditalea andensis TaxID=1048983 RepID=A0A074KXH2_9BACT|nr:glycosyltransferase family 2 protein [Anditalea andensis]KEO73629.1 hypothetical protein EL17_12070 [Anditalea andensis]
MNLSTLKTTPSVAIIIVNWNSYAHTRGCLASLRKVSYNNFKVVVVDNGSQDGSDKKLEDEFAEIILLRNNENKGFTGGNNRGIAYALDQKFEYLMLLNNDTEVEPDFLDELLKVIEGDTSIGAIQPKFYFLNNKDRIWNAGGIIIKSIGLIRTIGENKKTKGKYNQPKETEWITGCCFMVRAEIIRNIGGLNDRFFMYYEDVEWSLRIRDAGFKLEYCPSAVVYHEAGMSNKNKLKSKEGYINPVVHFLASRNHLLILRKYTPWYLVVPVILFQSIKYGTILTYFLVRSRFKKLRSVLLGLKEGLFSNMI